MRPICLQQKRVKIPTQKFITYENERFKCMCVSGCVGCLGFGVCAEQMVFPKVRDSMTLHFYVLYNVTYIRIFNFDAMVSLFRMVKILSIEFFHHAPFLDSAVR